MSAPFVTLPTTRNSARARYAKWARRQNKRREERYLNSQEGHDALEEGGGGVVRDRQIRIHTLVL